MLKDCESYVSVEINLKIQHLPQRWNNIKMAAVDAKHQVSSLQVNEVAVVRKRLATFEGILVVYRDEFHRMLFFK